MILLSMMLLATGIFLGFLALDIDDPKIRMYLFFISIFVVISSLFAFAVVTSNNPVVQVKVYDNAGNLLEVYNESYSAESANMVSELSSWVGYALFFAVFFVLLMMYFIEELKGIFDSVTRFIKS